MEQLRMSMELNRPVFIEPLCAPYRLRTFSPGDESAWEQIVLTVFGGKVGFDELKADPAYRPEHIFFVTDEKDRPVATATLWLVPQEYPDGMAVLHMVGTLPEHRGHALGRIVSAAAIAQAKKEGFSSMTLKTDDFRIPAVINYLHLGFLPRPLDESQVKRWKDILEKLGREDLAQNLPALMWRG